MAVLKFSSKSNPAAAGANMKYITRDSAADSISFHNLPELENEDHTLAKSNAINYAEERSIQEENRVRRNERGTPRNHHRMVISFDRKEETAIAKEEVHKFMDKEFSNQKAVVSIHQDGEHTHAHVWIDCRNVDDDKKMQISAAKYRSLDERWAKQYDAKYKTEYAREFLEKKEETRAWKAKEAARIKEGKQLRPHTKPRRANDSKSLTMRKKETRDYGIDERPAGGGQQPATRGRRVADKAGERVAESRRNVIESKRILTERAGRSELANRTANDAIEQIKEISRGIKDLPERTTRDKDIDRGRSR